MENVSRRSFIELTIGSLMSLPALAGGLIVAPTTALAAGDTIYERCRSENEAREDEE